MDVTLPDGHVITGVPDGMTQSALITKLNANGIDTSWYKPDTAPAANIPSTDQNAATDNPIPGAVGDESKYNLDQSTSSIPSATVKPTGLMSLHDQWAKGFEHVPDPSKMPSLVRSALTEASDFGKLSGQALTAPVMAYDAIRNAITGGNDTTASEHAKAMFVKPWEDRMAWSSIKPEEKQDFLDKVGSGIGSMLVDLPLIIATGGAGEIEGVAKAAQPTVQYLADTLSHGFKSMMLPMIKSGVRKTEEALNEGRSYGDAIKEGSTEALITGFTGSAPMSLEGNFLKRFITGIPVGGAVSEAVRQVNNMVAPADKQQPFDLENLAVGSIQNAMLASAAGHKAPDEAPSRVDLGYENPASVTAEGAPKEFDNVSPVVDKMQAIRPLKESPQVNEADVVNAPSVDDAIATANKEVNAADIPVKESLTIDHIQPVLDSINPKLSTGEVKVVPTTADLPDHIQQRIDANGEPVEGVYTEGSGKVHLVADAFDNLDRVHQVLGHELVGHLAPTEIIDPKIYSNAINSVIAMDKAGNANIQKLGAIVDERQPGLDQHTRAKEIMAMAVENNSYKNSPVLRRVAADITYSVKKYLINKGVDNAWVNKLSDHEVHSMLREGERRLYSGKAEEYTSKPAINEPSSVSIDDSTKAIKPKLAKDREKPKSLFESSIDYKVNTEDNGQINVSVKKSKDGSVYLFEDNGTIKEFNPEFAKDKSDADLLKYQYEPLGYESHEIINSKDEPIAKDTFSAPAQINDKQAKQVFIDMPGIKAGDLVSAKGTHFKSKEAAQVVAKLAGPGWVLKNVKQGYTVRFQPKTEAQIAAAKASTKARNSINTDTDSLHAAIAKLGGMNRDELVKDWGADPKEMANLRSGIKLVAPIKGMPIDRIADSLKELGYIGEDEHGKHDLNELMDHFFAELGGDKHYTPEGYARVAKDQDAAEHENYLAEKEIKDAEFSKLSETYQNYIDERVGEFKDLTEEDHAKLERELQEWEDWVKLNQHIIPDNGDEELDSSGRRLVSGAGEIGGDSAGENPSNEDLYQPYEGALSKQEEVRRSGTGSQGTAEEFGLKGQTQEEARAQADQQAKLKQEQELKAKEAEQRAQADADRDSFNLTGSDRKADIEAANGQQDLSGKTKSPIEIANANHDNSINDEFTQKLQALAEPSADGKNENHTVKLFDVSETAAKEAKDKIGLDIAGYHHTADKYAVRHVLNRHGDARIEKERGQLAITPDDIGKIADIIANPDARVYGAKTPRKQDVIASIKRLPDGTVLVVEEARTGRKTLALTSLRKYPVAKDFDSIAQTLLSNARSDNGGGFIVAHQNPQDLLASNPEVQVEKAKEALDKAGVTGTDRTSTIAAVRRGDLTAEEVAESHKPAAKIEDFGEVIGGAKKDLGGDEKPYPYPTKAEQEKINPAFDKLFDTLQTKATEKGVALFSRRIHGNRTNSHDYIIPETKEFEENNNGDLAYSPKSAEKRGIEQLPIRLTVGIARDEHRGFGIIHIKDSAESNMARLPKEITGDLAEDFARQIANIAKTYDQVYTEGDKVIFRSSRDQLALVTKEMEDRSTGEKYRSVITVVPSKKPVWGQPDWVERKDFSTDRMLQPRASVPSPDHTTQQSDRQLQRSQSSKFDFSTQESSSVKTNPSVIVRKRRTYTMDEVKKDDSDNGKNTYFSRKNKDVEEESPINPAGGKSEELWDRARNFIKDISSTIENHPVTQDLLLKVAPMSTGSDQARAVAKDFANADRTARWQWNSFDDLLKKNFTEDQLKTMWEAADEENVLRQQGNKDDSRGLGRLSPEERNVVEALHQYGEELLQRAKEVGMFQGEGLPFWAPRMAVMLGDDGEYYRPPAPAGGGAKEGGNITTSSQNLKQRKFLTADETEAAMKAKLGDDAQLVKNIRTMPLAMARLERAIAGRELVNSIKDLGTKVGTNLVSSSEGPGFFTVDHPAFKTFKPRMVEEDGKYVPAVDQNGEMIFDRTPIYISDEFKGPLKAIMTDKPGAPYQALMTIKAKAMGLIMYSPLIHNAVEWGRALPIMPGKVLTFKIYFEGNAIKNDPVQMRQAIKDGLVPIGHRAGMQDITGLMEDPTIEAGRSWTAKIAGKIADQISEDAGQSVRKGIDKAGDVWHNTLLWDRVGDLQAGIYSNVKADLIGEGMDETSAGRIAAHFANRFAGALPNEAMSANARKIANFALFSRTFTLGNLGVLKDAITGLPADVKAQISRDAQELGMRSAKNIARKEAIGAIIFDMTLMLVGNSLLQDALNVMNGQSLDETEDGYVRRFKAYMNSVTDNPFNLVSNISQISSTADNEPGKENRIRYGTDSDGTELYFRLPIGKIGEEFAGWLTSPLKTLTNKEGTLLKPILQIFHDDKGLGQPVYDEYAKTLSMDTVKNAGRVATLLMNAQLPTDALVSAYDIARGKGNSMDVSKTFGPLVGVTISPGTPGGPAVGEMYDADRKYKMRVSFAMPDVKRALKDDDIDRAVELLQNAGMQPSEIRSRLKAMLEPESRLNHGAIKRFEKHSTDEQKDRFSNAVGG